MTPDILQPRPGAVPHATPRLPCFHPHGARGARAHRILHSVLFSLSYTSFTALVGLSLPIQLPPPLPLMPLFCLCAGFSFDFRRVRACPSRPTSFPTSSVTCGCSSATQSRRRPDGSSSQQQQRQPRLRPPVVRGRRRGSHSCSSERGAGSAQPSGGGGGTSPERDAVHAVPTPCARQGPSPRAPCGCHHRALCARRWQPRFAGRTCRSCGRGGFGGRDSGGACPPSTLTPRVRVQCTLCDRCD